VQSLAGVHRRLEESERIREEQEERISHLETEVHLLRNDTPFSSSSPLSNSALNVPEDDVPRSAITTSSSIVGGAAVLFGSDEVTVPQLVEALTREFNVRRDLEAVVSRVESQVHTLSRTVHRLQRELNEQQAQSQFGQHKLRPVGRDLTR